MRDSDVKKSDFVQKTAVVDADSFDFVQDGQNFKVPFSAMKTAMGALGTIAQLGEVTAVPVLKATGTDYEIRNILGGSGILASLSPEDGIKLSHNFTVDTTGKAIMTNPTADSPTIRSLVAGSSINISELNGTLEIAYSATPTTSKTVIVNQESDFPTAVGNVITLLADTLYFIASDITTANRFVLQEDTIVSGSDGTLITLTYSGSGVMFTSSDTSNKVKDLGCACTSGTLLDISGSVGNEIFQLLSCAVECDVIGTIDEMYVASFQNITWTVITDGLTFLNNTDIISFFQNVGSIAAGTFVDFGSSTFTGFTFSNSIGVLAVGATFLSGLVDSGNVNAGGLASVINTRALGAGTALNNITTKDSLWEFLANSGIANSRNTYLGTNAGATVIIAVINTPVIIGATWVSEEESRFEGTAGGRFTYIGSGAFIDISATITADIVTATDNCTFYIYKNGVKEANSGMLRELSAGNPGNFGLEWALDLATNDYIEIWAENNDTTVNIVIHKAIIKVT